MQFFSSDSASSDDYRRRARRIRASFAGNSFLTQQALGDLARRRNLEVEQCNDAGVGVFPLSGSVSRRSGPSEYLRTGLGLAENSALKLDVTAVVERGFCERAGSKLQSFGFTFSDRVGLLNAAERLGITRFRANLLLAIVEKSTPARQTGLAPIASRSFASSLLAILMLEVLIVGAIIWVIIPT